MKRLAVIALTGWCLLAFSAVAHAQGLKERSLTDKPAAPAQQQAPAAPAAPAPAYQPAPAPAATPAPAPTYQPAPAGGGTPVNGQPVGAPPQAPPPPPGADGGTPVNGQPIGSPPPPPPPPPPPSNTYNREEVNREVLGYFESGSRGLAELVAKAFKDQGQPSGFIKGNEGGGALIVGLRYGEGTLYLKGQPPVHVFWQSPSLGFDLGVNAGKVFTLIYGMSRPEELFQRYPAVDGSLYLIGGFGMNYQHTNGVTLAPIRVGVGLRLGANLGYQHYTREKSINPF
jgi:hypothetical protein